MRRLLLVDAVSNNFLRVYVRALSQTDAIDVTHWHLDELFSNYPEGARTKYAIFPPAECTLPFIRHDRRYLYKRSVNRYPDQFWAEIIAYRVGCALDVSVPPAFAAFDLDTGRCGALIEWFYTDGECSLISGGNYMQIIDPQYDRKKGELHNFRWIAKIGTVFARNKTSQDDWQQYWANCALFDALIGNTDRHQDNWGYMVFRPDQSGSRLRKLSPLFDNGTSLGHEYFTENVAKWDRAKFEWYVGRGTHHMKWEATDLKKCGHFELVARIVQTYPSTKTALQGMIAGFSIARIRSELEHLQQLRLSVPLTKERTNFVLTLLTIRKEKLEAVLR